MTAITLHRRNPAKNLQTYYVLNMQHDLFGAWCFVRDWGRLGQRGGQSRILPYPNPRPEAQAALDRQRPANGVQRIVGDIPGGRPDNRHHSLAA